MCREQPLELLVDPIQDIDMLRFHRRYPRHPILHTECLSYPIAVPIHFRLLQWVVALS